MNRMRISPGISNRVVGWLANSDFDGWPSCRGLAHIRTAHTDRCLPRALWRWAEANFCSHALQTAGINSLRQCTVVVYRLLYRSANNFLITWLAKSNSVTDLLLVDHPCGSVVDRELAACAAAVAAIVGYPSGTAPSASFHKALGKIFITINAACPFSHAPRT